MIIWKSALLDGYLFPQVGKRTVLMMCFLVTFFLCLGPLPGLSQEQGRKTVQSAAAPQAQVEPARQLPPLDPKRVEYAFRSLFFTTVPLILAVLVLMLILKFDEKSKEKLEPFFGQGQITQLVVIIIIAGNICSMAIAGIVGASEVSAIYGGIVGYVLGKKMGA